MIASKATPPPSNFFQIGHIFLRFDKCHWESLQFFSTWMYRHEFYTKKQNTNKIQLSLVMWFKLLRKLQTCPTDLLLAFYSQLLSQYIGCKNQGKKKKENTQVWILKRLQAKIIYVNVASKKLEELSTELQHNNGGYTRWKWGQAMEGEMQKYCLDPHGCSLKTEVLTWVEMRKQCQRQQEQLLLLHEQQRMNKENASSVLNQ